MPVTPPGIDRLAVIVPAYNEATRIGACLASIRTAAGTCPAPVRVIVVADSCADATARIARDAGAEVLPVAVRNTGRARAAGCARAIGDDPAGLWLAHTDADTVVPADWLRRQWHDGNGGIDVIAGPVMVTDWHEWPAEMRVRFEEFYAAERARGRHHVHGCNLGLSAAAYLRLGGFPALAVGEDRALVTAARDAGLIVGYPSDLAVRTSGRRHARVIGGGFHHFLTLMADAL